MNRISYDMASRLEEKGFGDIGVDLFATMDMPPKPDNITFLVDLGSVRPDMLVFNKDASMDISVDSFQVVARGAPGDVNNCYDRLMDVKRILHRSESFYVARKRYEQTLHKSGPMELPLDDSRRPFMTMTFTTKTSWYLFRPVAICLRSKLLQKTKTHSCLDVF